MQINKTPMAIKKDKPAVIHKDPIAQDERMENNAHVPIADIAMRKNDDEYIWHLASIVESSDDAIISKSLDGIIKSWNKASERMFGYTAGQAIGQHISLVIPPEYVDEEKKIMERIRNNEIITHFETMRVKKKRRTILCFFHRLTAQGQVRKYYWRIQNSAWHYIC